MAGKSRAKRSELLVAPYKVTDGSSFRLADADPGDTGGIKAKKRAELVLQERIGHLAALQEKLYAQDQWAVLLIFQAMDAAGKDSTIEHVMSGINPQGCEVYSFKVPSAEELDHDFLWRTSKCLPERGRIGIFNRSYYEEVLVVRVHPEFLGGQKLPAGLVGKGIWKRRFEDIVAFERYLARQGYIILKFFLHVSKEEQKRRFLARIEQPEKNWKFSAADVAERRHWKRYMAAYEDMIRHTARQARPVVRRPRRQQVVHAPRRRRGSPRSPRRPRPRLPAPRRREEAGAPRGGQGPGGGEVAAARGRPALSPSCLPARSHDRARPCLSGRIRLRGAVMATNHIQEESIESPSRSRFTVTFSLQLNDAQYAEIQDLAKRHGVSMARVARRALRSGLIVLRQTPKLAAEFSQPE